MSSEQLSVTKCRGGKFGCGLSSPNIAVVLSRQRNAPKLVMRIQSAIVKELTDILKIFFNFTI
ncbi:MAG: hypothetical protein AAF630_11850, partial [Cyanobacteria bacterium P01_C01_bin.38]